MKPLIFQEKGLFQAPLRVNFMTKWKIILCHLSLKPSLHSISKPQSREKVKKIERHQCSRSYFTSLFLICLHQKDFKTETFNRSLTDSWWEDQWSKAGDIWKRNVFCCGDWWENEEERELEFLKWRLIKLKAQETSLGEGEQWIPPPLRGSMLCPSRERQATCPSEKSVVAKWCSWESQLQEASHTWWVQLCPRVNVCQWNNPCEVVMAFVKKQGIQDMIPLVLSESFTRSSFHLSIFLASMNPGPSTVFQSRNGTAEIFVFSVHRLLMRWMKLLIPLTCIYHLLPFSPSSLEAYWFVPETKVEALSDYILELELTHS